MEIQNLRPIRSIGQAVLRCSQWSWPVQGIKERVPQIVTSQNILN